MYSNFSPLLLPNPPNIRGGLIRPPFFSDLSMWLKPQKPQQFADGSWGYEDFAGKDGRPLRGGFCLEGNGVLTVNFTAALANTEMTYFNGTTDATFTTDAQGKWTPTVGTRFYNIRQIVNNIVVRQWIVNEETGNILFCSIDDNLQENTLPSFDSGNWTGNTELIEGSKVFYNNDGSAVLNQSFVVPNTNVRNFWVRSENLNGVNYNLTATINGVTVISGQQTEGLFVDNSPESFATTNLNIQLSFSANSATKFTIAEVGYSFYYKRINATLEGETPSDWKLDQRFESFADRFGYTNDNGVIVPLIYSEYLNPTKTDAQGNDAEFTGQAKIPVRTLGKVMGFGGTESVDTGIKLNPYEDFELHLPLFCEIDQVIKFIISSYISGDAGRFLLSYIPGRVIRFQIGSHTTDSSVNVYPLNEWFLLSFIKIDDRYLVKINNNIIIDTTTTNKITQNINLEISSSTVSYMSKQLVAYLNLKTSNKNRFYVRDDDGNVVDLVQGEAGYPPINGTLVGNLTNFNQTSEYTEPIELTKGFTDDNGTIVLPQLDSNLNPTGLDVNGGVLTNPAGKWHNGADIPLVIDEKASSVASVENLQGFEYWFNSSQVPREVDYDERNYNVFDVGTQYNTHFSNAEEKKWRDQMVFRTPKTDSELIKVYKFVKFSRFWDDSLTWDDTTNIWVD